MKPRIVKRLIYVLPITGLASLMLAGFLFMGGFSFVDSAEAGCGGRLPYRSCGWERERDRKPTKTITTIRTTTTSTFDGTITESAQ